MMELVPSVVLTIHAYKSSNERRLCFGGCRASAESCTAQGGAYVSQVYIRLQTSQVVYIIHLQLLSCDSIKGLKKQWGRPNNTLSSL